MTRRRMTDEEVSRLPLSAARAELMEEIMRLDAASAREKQARARSRGWLTVAGAAAAVAVLAGVAFVVPGLGGSDEPDRSATSSGPTATPTPTTTPKAPRTKASEAPATIPVTPAPPGSREWVALPLEGWVPDYVSESSGWREVTYENGRQQLSISLAPAELHASYVEDRRRIGSKPDDGTVVTLLGEDARMWPYSAKDHTSIGPVEGDVYPEVRGSGMNRADYLALLAELVWVDRATFQSLLPEEKFTDDEGRAAQVDEMLAGVPVPLDMESISSDEVDRYHLGADVAGAVACAWLDMFAEAKRSGDPDAAMAARGALATARDWPVLIEMDETGDYPDVLWGYAEQVQRGEVPQGYDQGLGCS